MAECSSCGRVIDSGKSLCPQCQAKLKSEDTDKKLEPATDIDPSDDKLEVEDELIKVESSPYDDFIMDMTEDKQPAPDDEPFEKKNLADELDTEVRMTDDYSQNRSDDKKPDNKTAKQDKHVTKEAISLSEREQLLSSLQSKIPNIIKQKHMGPENSHEEHPAPKKPVPSKPKAKQSQPSQKKADQPPARPKSQPSSPAPAPERQGGSGKVYVKGSRAWFENNVKLRPGARLGYNGRNYTLLPKPFDRKPYIFAAAAMLVIIVLGTLVLPGMFSSGGPAKVVGVLVNSDTKTVVPNAQVIINELSRKVYSDENGMFIFDQVPEGDWSISASKMQFRTAALSFSHKTTPSLLTMRMDPSITTAEIEEAEQKAEEEKRKNKTPQRTYGNLKVVSNVPDARVIIDNKVMGNADKTYSRLYTGKHKLVVTKEGFKEYSGTFSVRKNKTTKVDVNLQEIDLAYDPSEISYSEYLSMADDLAEKGEWQEASGNYTLALAKNEDGTTYYKRAKAFMKLNRKSQARADLFKAASFFVVENDLSQAMACYNDVLDMEPENARALRNRGFVYLRRNDHKAALKDLERAKDIDDDSFESMIALGEAFYIMGNYKESLKYLKKARKKDENSARAFALSALASMARGKEKDARKYLFGFEQRAGVSELNEFNSYPEWKQLKKLAQEED